MQKVETCTRCGGMASAGAMRSRAPMNIGPPGICTMLEGHAPTGAAAAVDEPVALAEAAPLDPAATPEPDASAEGLLRRSRKPPTAAASTRGTATRTTLGNEEGAGA